MIAYDILCTVGSIAAVFCFGLLQPTILQATSMLYVCLPLMLAVCCQSWLSGSMLPEPCFNLSVGNRHIAGGLVPDAELDVRVWDWVQEPRHEHFVGLPQHCNRKYLLNWPGNSYSARLKYLLLCGSVVIHSDNGWYEFFYHMLKHGEQYVRIEPLTEDKDLHHDLADLVRRLQADQVHSRRIAEVGQHFARETLSYDSIKEYWHRLLHEYAALQNNEVVLHHDAVPLGFSVSRPQYISLEDRHGCPKRNPDAVPHAAAEFLPAEPGALGHTGPLAS